MAKEDLERIKKDLDNAQKYLKSAGDRADRVGDKSGSKRIREREDGVSKLRKGFGGNENSR